MLRLVSNTCVAALLATSTVVIGQAGQADIIFLGAKVVTADPSQPIAEAIALAGDRIRAVGSIEEIRRLAGVQTRSVNLQGATIIPGLIDAHVHLLIAPQITDDRLLPAEVSTWNYDGEIGGGSTALHRGASRSDEQFGCGAASGGYRPPGYFAWLSRCNASLC